MTASGELFVEETIYGYIEDELKKHFGEEVQIDSTKYSGLSETELPRIVEAPILNENDEVVGWIEARLEFVVSDYCGFDYPYVIEPLIRSVKIFKKEGKKTVEVASITCDDPHENTRKEIREAINKIKENKIEEALAILNKLLEKETLD